MAKRHCVIVARSGRALAASANKAGYTVHVIDAFADADVNAVTVQRCDYSDSGFNLAQLNALLSELQARYPLAIAIAGSGIEQQHLLLQSLASPVLHCVNTPATLAQFTNPFQFAALLEQLGIAAVPVYKQPTNNQARLLRKRIGGMGGEHVVEHAGHGINASDTYYQDYVPGSVYSAVFLADGKTQTTIGYNVLQQTSLISNKPFLLKGACSTVPNEQIQVYIQQCLDSIVRASQLTGLCGLDFIVDDKEKVHLLEINPRPPATLELHEGEQSLVAAHVACFEQSPVSYTRCEQHRGYVIIYATGAFTIDAKQQWPVWTRDQPRPGTRIEQGHPVCTIHAEAETTAAVEQLLDARKQALKSSLECALI